MKYKNLFPSALPLVLLAVSTSACKKLPDEELRNLPQIKRSASRDNPTATQIIILPTHEFKPMLSIKDQVRTIAALEGINPSFVYALVKHESSFNPLAFSETAAMGLMQLEPENTGYHSICPEIRTPSDARNPEKNLRCGCRLFKNNYLVKHRNLSAALAYWHGGTRCAKNRNCPRTERFVQVVLRDFPQNQPVLSDD